MVSDLLQSIPDYRPPLLHRSAFLSSVLPNKLRKPQAPVYTRQRAELPDGDFIDLDWIQQGNSRLAILMHGLEGSSQSTYIRGMAGALARNGYDVLAMNHRSCSEEMNRLPVAYHAGRTQDLLWTVEHLTTAYSRVVVIGYSLGANMSLVAAGRDQLHQFTQVKAVVAVSVPCDLLESSAMWNQRRFSVILPYFVKQLRTKVERKKALLPDLPVDMNAIARSKTFFDFDDHFTAPIHGFRDAADYYIQNSSAQFIPAIQLPTLIINAENDGFLSPQCYPQSAVDANPQVEMLRPRFGGHVGFAMDHSLKRFWHEEVILRYLSAV